MAVPRTTRLAAWPESAHSSPAGLPVCMTGTNGRPSSPGRSVAPLGRREIMNRIVTALLCLWCGPALAQTAQELIDTGKNPDNIPTFGMGYRLNQDRKSVV